MLYVTNTYGGYSNLQSTLTVFIDVWKCWTGLKWLRIGCRGCDLDGGTENTCSLKQEFLLSVNSVARGGVGDRFSCKLQTSLSIHNEFVSSQRRIKREGYSLL
jgi:hypothetical protein